MIMFTIGLKASAVAARAILDLVEDISSMDADAIQVVSLESYTVTKDLPVPLARGCGGRHNRPCPPVQPVTTGNPFVEQAVESSSMRKRIQAQKASPSGRNRVVYEVVGSVPPGTHVKGVPARILKHLMTYAGSNGDGMSAKAIEVQLGMKRKSVESALYLLRTLGVVQSIAI